jgi:hypothetical protein
MEIRKKEPNNIKNNRGAMKKRNRKPAPFNYKKKDIEIHGQDDRWWLILLCYFESFRPYLMPLIYGVSGGFIGHWVQKILSG